jgi:xanthine dehydrogenase accessory factor
MGLLEALETRAFYVGAMGSSRTSEKRRVRLRELGVSDAALSRLHAPVGLPIGSKTPPEIAIAILAELTQVVRTTTAGSEATAAAG